MAIGGNRGLRGARITILALIIPVLSGLLYLALFGAPTAFLAINAAALIAGAIWIAFGRLPRAPTQRLILLTALLALFALPLIAGPETDGVTRWISIGGFSLHVGMLALPLLCVMAADQRRIGALALLVATLIAFAQPDSASALALAFASLAIWWTNREGVFAAVGALGLFAALGASFSGALPAQPYVEGILQQLWQQSPAMALFLGSALATGLGIMMFGSTAGRSSRFALVGAFAGFVLAAMLGDYPFPLIGYGAAPILGLALALSETKDPAT